MEDLLRQLPNARPAGTVRPARISLDSLKGFLDAVPDLSREQAQTRPAAAPSPTPSADANWMEDCGLVAAAARHKARREAKLHAHMEQGEDWSLTKVLRDAKVAELTRRLALSKRP